MFQLVKKAAVVTALSIAPTFALAQENLEDKFPLARPDFLKSSNCLEAMSFQTAQMIDNKHIMLNIMSTVYGCLQIIANSPRYNHEEVNGLMQLTVFQIQVLNREYARLNDIDLEKVEVDGIFDEATSNDFIMIAEREGYNLLFTERIAVATPKETVFLRAFADFLYSQSPENFRAAAEAVGNNSLAKDLQSATPSDQELETEPEAKENREVVKLTLCDTLPLQQIGTLVCDL